MKPVRIGLLGSGFITDIHAHAMRSIPMDVEIAAVASRTPGKAAKFAEHFGIPAAFSGLEEMLKKSNLDAVTIAVPNNLHCWACETIARAGKHVICEKP